MQEVNEYLMKPVCEDQMSQLILKSMNVTQTFSCGPSSGLATRMKTTWLEVSCNCRKLHALVIIKMINTKKKKKKIECKILHV